MFRRIASLLSSAQVAEICAALSDPSAPWVDGRTTAGHQGAQVKYNEQLAESSALARELGGSIISQLERNPLFVSAVLPNTVYPPMFNRFGPGMQFGAHVDGAVRMLPGTVRKLRTDLSATLFLTPPQAYDGGELLIENDSGEHSFKLSAGDLLVYSAAARHRVSTVTRGTRLACVFWIQSLVKDDAERLQLFELDETIQHLTRDGADATSILRLTSLYHGLLRRWSEI